MEKIIVKSPSEKKNKYGMYEVYCKIESRKRLTDKQLESIGWQIIGDLFDIASVNIKRTIEELKDTEEDLE